MLQNESGVRIPTFFYVIIYYNFDLKNPSFFIKEFFFH